MLLEVIYFISVLLSTLKGQNLALLRPSTQSSTYSIYKSELANDGDRSTCSVTGDDGSPNKFGWWQVDLEGEYGITQLTIVTSWYAFIFLDHFDIWITNNSMTNFTNYNAGLCESLDKTNTSSDDEFNVTCLVVNQGRYVTIIKSNGTKHNTLSLCEVEIYSNTVACQKGEYHCLNVQKCVSVDKVCDDVSDCMDGSDEKNCDSTKLPQSGETTCRVGQFTCEKGRCINDRLRCDGYYDCLNMIDEADCTVGTNCLENEFVCLNRQCIDASLKCDGYTDCSDDTDEAPTQCGISKCQPGMRACTRSGRCISSSLFCDRVISCSDGSDEAQRICGIYPSSCKVGEFFCNSGQCLNGTLKCDNVTNCDDSSDESKELCGYPMLKPPCDPIAQFTCSYGSCIDIRLKCDDLNDCTDGSDELDCAKCRYNTEFLCRSDNICLPKFKKCNGKGDCSDQSDESDCYSCVEPSFFCPALSICMTPSLKCNHVLDCPDGTDEVGCECPPSWRKCEMGSCISEDYMCDGNLDCPYGDDERESTCRKFCSGYYCNNIGCTNGSVWCNGVVDCPEGEDETDEACRSMGVCGQNFKCQNNKCISNGWVCDKQIDCISGEDESNDCDVKEKNCSDNKFNCLIGNVPCVDLERRCDGVPDCNDGSDEIGCLFMGKITGQRELLMLISNQPYRICFDNFTDVWKSIMCSYMDMTNHAPTIDKRLETNRYATIDPGYNLKSIFNIVKAFRLDFVFFCSSGPIESLYCKISNCGINSLKSKIVTGYPADHGMWPWHGLLKIERKRICGATYIGGKWFLTSASCVTKTGSNTPIKLTDIKLYTNSLQVTGSDGLLQNLTRLTIHNRYDNITGANDVALLKVENTPDEHFVKEVCLPDPYLYAYNNINRDIINNNMEVKLCYVSGFGLNRKDRFPSPFLSNARFKIMNDKQCSELINNISHVQYIVNDTTNFCAGDHQSKYSYNICEYDFGGPLVCLGSNNRWIQLGIASRNIGGECDISIFTRVTSYLEMIYDAYVLD